MFYFVYCFFFFNDTATTEIYTLSLHDALPIWIRRGSPTSRTSRRRSASRDRGSPPSRRSEEHTSELQSLAYLVCRLLLEKKKKNKKLHIHNKKKNKKKQINILLFFLLFFSSIFFFSFFFFFFFFNDTATTEIYTLSLHDALPFFTTKPGDREVSAESIRRILSAVGSADIVV